LNAHESPAVVWVEVMGSEKVNMYRPPVPKAALSAVWPASPLTRLPVISMVPLSRMLVMNSLSTPLLKLLTSSVSHLAPRRGALRISKMGTNVGVAVPIVGPMERMDERPGCALLRV
jgi:hypothetical protein